MISTAHVTDLPVGSNVLPLFPSRSREDLRASQYGSAADDPFASHVTAPSSQRWYEDELLSGSPR